VVSNARQKLGFPLSNYETVKFIRSTTANGKVIRAYVLKTTGKENSKSMPIYTNLYNDFSAPSIVATALCFKQRKLRNSCIELHMKYTETK